MKIISIQSARYMDEDRWDVGEEIRYGSGKYITEIVDGTVDIVDETFTPIYRIYVNNKLWKDLINMPVKVEYDIED